MRALVVVVGIGVLLLLCRICDAAPACNIGQGITTATTCDIAADAWRAHGPATIGRCMLGGYAVTTLRAHGPTTVTFVPQRTGLTRMVVAARALVNESTPCAVPNEALFAAPPADTLVVAQVRGASSVSLTLPEPAVYAVSVLGWEYGYMEGGVSGSTVNKTYAYAVYDANPQLWVTNYPGEYPDYRTRVVRWDEPPGGSSSRATGDTKFLHFAVRACAPPGPCALPCDASCTEADERVCVVGNATCTCPYFTYVLGCRDRCSLEKYKSCPAGGSLFLSAAARASTAFAVALVAASHAIVIAVGAM
jgi:hypothetical protein